MRRIPIVVLFVFIAVMPTNSSALYGPENEITIPREKISEARRILNRSRIGTRQIGGHHAVLAVWRAGSDERVMTILVRKGRSRTRGFSVELLHRNGVNSTYAVTKPDGYHVLAIRTNVKNYGGKSWSRPVIYIPYSELIHTKRLTEEGLRYLEGTVEAARQRLTAKDVRSYIDPSTNVTQQTEARVLISLLIVEHITDRERLNLDGPDAEQIIERVLVTLGANGSDTYDFARSSAGAMGLAQFMPRTYRNTRLNYPAARLHLNHMHGMQDHVNAVIAMYCLADWIQTSLGPDELSALRRDPEEIGAYIAAAYNGGHHRAVRAYTRFPDSWDQHHGRRGLLKNTTKYVKTFRLVYRYLQEKARLL